MSGGIIDPRTNMPAQEEPIVICVDKIRMPVPTDDSQIMAQAALTETGQMKIDPSTLTLWIETSKACDAIRTRLDALEAAGGIAADDPARTALRALMGDKDQGEEQDQ